jgi:tetratricopeptide (TPR) repeat protein
MDKPDGLPMRAWEYYVLGYWLHSLMTKTANRQAREMFKAAIGEAAKAKTEFARAYGYLSYSLLIAYLHGWKEDGVPADQEVGIAKVVEYADRAFKSNPDDYDNRWSWAISLVFEGNFQSKRVDEGLAEYDRAVAAAAKQAVPDNLHHIRVERADALFFAGNGLEDIKRAIADTKEAIEAVPHNAKWYLWTLGWAYYEAGAYEDEAENAAQSLNALLQFKNPPDLIVKNIIASCMALECGELAARWAGEFLARNPGYTLDFEDRWPYRDEQRRVRFKQHLSDAGLPGEVRRRSPPGKAVRRRSK